MINDKPRLPIKSMLLMGWLPSFLKCWIYRCRGYRIGRGVKLSFGAVICTGKAVIGNDVRMGFFSFIRGREVALGNRVEIGAMCFLDTPHLEIGDDSKLNEQVYVGGLQFPDSRLIVGKNCQIMQMTFINPTRSITIGDDSGIGGDCLLFGHASWLSRFEGYPVVFKPIEIGKSVSISWRVFIGAGAKIGDGAVIGANSFVNHTIPPRCLATGSPARVVVKAPWFPRTVENPEKETMLQSILCEMAGYLEGHGVACRQDGDNIEVSWKRQGWFSSGSRRELIRVVTASLEDTSLLPMQEGTSVLLSLHKIPDALRRQLRSRGIIWIDIESKERADAGGDLADEVAHYLRRHGVRFNRPPASNGTGSAPEETTQSFNPPA